VPPAERRAERQAAARIRGAGRGEQHQAWLARGGNRQLNLALFTIARSQARWHPDARDYLARKH
jgi:hypothetical protein